VPEAIHAGVVLASRYRLDDLLAEENGGLFWRAHDRVLHRPVAVHLLPEDDERADGLMEAARRSATLADRRLLRVLDADHQEGMTYVVNEWGQGSSLDIILDTDGPLQPRQAAWLVSEVGDTLARAHEAGMSHGRLAPENVLVDHNGQVRIIGFAVDAALHGLPASRSSTDVVDLAGLLYAALTGRWAGVSSSDVPPAPNEHGSVLRPRKVRAGIPRTLDTICDVVINPYTAAQPHRGPHDLMTARGLTEALRDFVGDATGLAVERAPHPQRTVAFPPAPPSPPAGPAAGPAAEPPAGAAGVPADAEPTVVTPAADRPTAEPGGPGPEPEPESEPQPEPAADPTDLPTQAGVPVFHDETDDVSWLQKRAEKPAPPPPFEEPPERPLFAPEPSDGAPARRPRPGATERTGADFPFWDSSSGTGQSWASSTADTGIVEEVPGRNWFRLAMIIGLCTLVLVAAVAAYQLGGSSGDTDEETPSGASTSSEPAPAEPIAGIEADDFDPQGDPPQEENSELVPLVLDDDPATTWRTATYLQDFGPGGLKTGVGLVLDLGGSEEVREVDVSVVGDTTAQVFVTDERPSSVDGLEPVGEGSTSGTLEVRPDEAVPGRYVTVWLTSLPAVDGGWRGEVSGVVVRG
jgi:serine/threonine kinase PknH